MDVNPARRIFIFGYWGDEFHETSEIKVFSAVQDDPLFEFHLKADFSISYKKNNSIN